MANTKPIGVAYEDQYLDGATIVNPIYPARGAPLTAQIGTLTFTAPSPQVLPIGTPVSPGFGFVSANEGLSVLAVIANLQTRVAQLESHLRALNLIA